MIERGIYFHDNVLFLYVHVTPMWYYEDVGEKIRLNLRCKAILALHGAALGDVRILFSCLQNPKELLWSDSVQAQAAEALKAEWCSCFYQVLGNSYLGCAPISSLEWKGVAVKRRPSHLLHPDLNIPP